MAKTSDHSIIISDPSKDKTGVWIEYRDMRNSKNVQIISTEWEKRFAAKVREYSDLPESLILESFFKWSGIPKATFHVLMEKSPTIQSAWDYAKLVLSERRRIGGWLGKYKDSVFRGIEQYSDEEKESLVFQAGLRNQDQGVAPTFTLNMIAAESTGLVKKRLRKDKDEVSPSIKPVE